MTNETKELIEGKLTKVFEEIVESVRVGLSEEMGPNDPEYDRILDERNSDASEKITSLIEEFGL